jgi:hypothetical protein
MKCPKFVAVVIKTGEIAHKKPPPLHEKPISCGGGGLCDSSVAQYGLPDLIFLLLIALSCGTAAFLVFDSVNLAFPLTYGAGPFP